MLKTRLIPVLLLQDGHLVRSERFREHQIIGDPLHEVERFIEWNVDEIIYLDITRGDHYAACRDDQKVAGLGDRLAILDAVSRRCFVPLTWGGHLSTVEQMRACLERGADKIAVNSAALARPALLTEAAETFGSQAVVVGIDVERAADGRLEVFTDGGRTTTGRNPAAWAREAADRGAGEVLLQSIDRDGSGRGYDVDLIREVAAAVSIPVIACGGVGRYEDYADGVRAGADAVAAANIFHFKEAADRNGKRALRSAGVDVRMEEMTWSFGTALGASTRASRQRR